MMKLILKITLSCLMITFITSSSLAINIYVDQATGDDSDDGMTPATAVATITHGSTLINSGDTINIGPGIYSATTGETYPVIFTDSINLEGAGPDLTTLDGESFSSLLDMTGNKAIVNINGLAVINGVGSVGAGIRIGAVAQFTASDCKVDNNVGNIGGGVFFSETTDITIIDCHFNGNDASIGGAIQVQINSNNDVVMDVIQSTFSNNTGSVGTAIQFQENGAGVHTLNIDQSRFFNNSASSVNYTTNGGTSFGQITNSVFAENTGVALNASSSDIDVINVTFSNNQQALSAGAQAKIINSIFWGNVIELSGISGSVSFSIIQGLEIDGHIDDGNNFDIDPLMTSDYHLTTNSAAIDMGSDQAIDDLNLTQDLDLEVRKVDWLGLNRPEGVVDVGADEVQDLIFANGFESP